MFQGSGPKRVTELCRNPIRRSSFAFTRHWSPASHGAGISWGWYLIFIPAQVHVSNCLLHVLYAPCRCASGTHSGNVWGGYSDFCNRTSENSCSTHLVNKGKSRERGGALKDS